MSTSNVRIRSTSFTNLITECIEEFDGIDSKDRIDRASGRLQVGENVLSEEIDHVDENVCRGDAKLASSQHFGYRWYTPDALNLEMQSR